MSSPTGPDRAPTAALDSADEPAPDRFRALKAVRSRVRALPGGALAWRIGVTVVGLAVIVVGIILLPLPGPGWLVIFLGLGLWATEFEWASRLLRFARDQVQRWTRWMGTLPRWKQLLVGGGLLIVVVGCIVGAYVLYRVLR